MTVFCRNNYGEQTVLRCETFATRSGFLRGHEAERGGVHAIAQAGGAGAVVEKGAEVGVAETAGDFVAGHAETVVSGNKNVFLRDWRPEAGPAGARFKFCVRVKEDVVAADAAIEPLRVIFEVGILESAFRTRVPGDAILLRLKQLAPLFVGLHYLRNSYHPKFFSGIVKLNYFHRAAVGVSGNKHARSGQFAPDGPEQQRTSSQTTQNRKKYAAIGFHWKPPDDRTRQPSRSTPGKSE